MMARKSSLGAANDVNISPVSAMAVQQTTVATHILRVVFDDLALHDNASNFAWRDHSIWSRHLANRVWKEKQGAGRQRVARVQGFRVKPTS